MLKLLCALFVLASPLMAGAPPPEILYKVRIGQLKVAADLYRAYCTKNECKDHELIQQMANIIIEQGWKSQDPEEQLLAIYGAGTARGPQMIYILGCGIEHPHPQIQLASLFFLAELCDDRADKLIKKALSSDYLIIRLEAAKILAAKKDSSTILQIEGLMCKLEPELHPLFPPFFALAGDTHSTAMLKKFFSSQNAEMRLATILSCVDYRRDDLLPQIRILATHGNIEEQEAATFALGALKDSSSIKLLEELRLSRHENVRLAANLSLYALGDTSVSPDIECLAKKGNLFAITALSSIPGSEDLLYALTKNSNLTVRYNATLALLNLKDPRCISSLTELLIKDARDIVVIEQPSPGLVLSAWKVIFSTREQIERIKQQPELATSLREAILQKSIELPYKDFFHLARRILESHDTELVPALIALIETLKNTEATQFLKNELHRAGAPLTRAFCNLALFRLKEPGPYAEYVRQWAKDFRHLELITFRPLVPQSRGKSSYSMTPQETCRLFIEALTALANQKDPEAIEALLSSMCQGNPKNRYALAGLLIRATE